MATPTARGTGRPGAHDGQQNQIPDGPLTLDETRRVAELHRRDLASRRIQGMFLQQRAACLGSTQDFLFSIESL